ncbi:M48 family metalloprotease [Streptacidiphilus sp. PB12-B1b]|uniref:M48 family metalloprotease n=1 Tax=Streptacidiphilus sp. PB12-B1b TaxID=2705012 RepID=UPI0015FD495D|nr:M48 family metalloprotease [Streptacidiphilus sp. PB12-B1b]QMU77754.1 M48 family metalloprotease [Streptacidiphilus sp. PB12-B1b]
MRILVYVPFAVCLLLSVAAPRPSRWLPPRAAAWGLACAALVAAGAWFWSLALLALTGLGQIPAVAALGAWSPRALAAADPVARLTAVGCGLALAAALGALALSARRHGLALVRACREARRLPGAGDLAVVDDDRLEAYAVPGLPGLARGRLVVSSGMLRALPGPEREALMAHERAHLRHRHHLFLLALHLAAAACPLLRPLGREGAFAVERWADENAAAAVGDRAVVARALARAALAKRDRGAAGVLAATGGPVPRRIRALLAAPPRRRLLPLVAGGLVLAVCCGSLVDATQDDAELFAGAAPHTAVGSVRHAVDDGRLRLPLRYDADGGTGRAQTRTDAAVVPNSRPSDQR